ncbi:MAG: helicase-related protein [Planctomycetota bacterium]
MTDKKLFPEIRIVDNSTDASKLEEALRRSMAPGGTLDVATGYFDVGALLALGEGWESLSGMRILLGASSGERTRKLLSDRLRQDASERFRSGLDEERRKDPLLQGLLRVVEALREGAIECRMHTLAGRKFHAKAYIASDAPEQAPSVAFVGSSNFTRAGLSTNVELNVGYDEEVSTRKLAAWFEEHWEEGEEITEDFTDLLERTVREYSPWEIYAKSVHELLRGRELTSNEWERTKSEIYPLLDENQKRGYHQLLGMAVGPRGRGGAFLCDGVGMGKTFIGLMLIERLCRYEKKRVVLFAPKSAKEAVWDKECEKRLLDLDGAFGKKLRLFAHTDLHKKSDGDVRTFEQVREEADVVVIDESHYFRNKGRRGGEGVDRSWYRKLYDLIENPDGTRKTVFLLTATPINNSLKDFQHQAELFLGEDDPRALAPFGIGNLPTEVKSLEKAIDQASQDPANTPALLKDSPLFKELVVQRSRSFAKAIQQDDPSARELHYPEREKPRVAHYSLRRGCGPLLDLLEATFLGGQADLQLSLYYPLRYDLTGDADPVEVNRQNQVVGLIRTLLVKRLESCVRSFEASCLQMLKKMIAFCEVNVLAGEEQSALERWRGKHASTIKGAELGQLQLWNEEGEVNDYQDEDFVPQELIDGFEPLDRAGVDVPKVLEDTYRDMDRLIQFLDLVRKVDQRLDDKARKLIEMLREDEDLKNQKVIVFTEFAHTARYLEKRLLEEGFTGVESVTSRSNKDRTDVVERFAPFYNGTTAIDLRTDGRKEIEILISTDMLAEGLNLHDATRLINYDIHWNPVQIIQRIGRVDRRLDPDKEDEIAESRTAEGLAGDRGRVVYWNFLPPDELDGLIQIMQQVSRKVFRISATLGIQAGHLLDPDEVLDDVQVLDRYEEFVEGTRSSEEELQLEHRAWLQEDPGLEAALEAIPAGVRSGMEGASGELGTGVFFCLRLPGRDMTASTDGTAVWNLEAGVTRWYYVPLAGAEGESHEVVEQLGPIRERIACDRAEQRVTRLDDDALRDAKARVDRHVRDTYVKKLQIPQGHKADLITWMEVHAG